MVYMSSTDLPVPRMAMLKAANALVEAGFIPDDMPDESLYVIATAALEAAAPLITDARWLRLRDTAAGDLADYREARENYQGNGEVADVARVQAKIDATKCFLRYMDELEQS
jgi:hypothetical protein